MRKCSDCIHELACASWNVGSIANANATHCVNFQKYETAFLDWLDGTGLSHEDFKRVYDEYLKDRI